jgi:hypothetical protein
VSSTLKAAKETVSDPEVQKVMANFTLSEIKIMLESGDEVEFAKKTLKKALDHIQG